jgi:hypothetical protein
LPLLLLLSAGCESTAPENHDPVVTSIVAFPQQVQAPDSFAVIVSAHDVDRDSLFYDWFCTNLNATIKGAPPETPYEYTNTKEHLATFYADSIAASSGHATVFCDVRDGKGGLKTVYVFVAITR